METYTTDNGVEVHLQPISLYEIDLIQDGTKEEWRKRGEKVDPPKYTSVAAGGAKIDHELTEDNLVVEDNEEETKRRQDEWKLYTDTIDRMNEEIGKLVTNLYLDGIVNITEVPQEWIERKKKRNIQIPEDKDDLLTLYKRVEIIKTINDMREIRARIIRLSLPNIPKQAAVGAAEKSFPGTVPQETE